MKVVISGYYGFHNVGDEAILLSIISALRANKADIEITVLSNDPDYTEKTYGVKAVNRWKLKEVYKALQHSDGLISGGGSLLQDSTSSKTIPYYTGIMMMAQMLKKPVFIYSQGMGPIHKSFNKWLTQFVLKRTTITVRDEASKQLLREIGLKQPIQIVPDPVMGFETTLQSNEWLDQLNLHNPILAVSVRDWPSDVPFKTYIARALDRFISQYGVSVVFLPMHGEHDMESSQSVVNMMENSAYIAPHTQSIEEKIALIGQADMLLGMRLHALIFAATEGTPFVALSYDPKIDAFSNIVGQKVVAHVNEYSWNEQQLFESLEYLLLNHADITLLLNDRASELKQKAKQTAEMAIKLFD